MPETARTGKRVFAKLQGEAQQAKRAENARTRNWAQMELGGVIGFAGCPGNVSSAASHDDLTNDHKPEHKGAGERWRKSLNGYPLTTGCGDRIPYLEALNCR